MDIILSIGFIFLVGLFFARFVNRFKFPSITAYLILGILMGPSVLNFISGKLLESSGLISNIVLGLIAFSIGQNFSRQSFSRIGKGILWISILEAAGAWIMVTCVFFLFLKQPFQISLLFGAISSATAPAATLMIVREYKAKGPFTDTLLGVVALDDAWCLIISALSLAIAKAVHTHLASALFLFRVIFKSLLGILGAFLVGGIMGWVLTFLSRFIRTQAELLLLCLGAIFISTGIAQQLHLSVLLANMFLGAILVNIDTANFRLFDTVKTIDSPLYLLFFVLAGASLEIGLLVQLGLLGLSYIIFRILGKAGGAYLGSAISGTSSQIRKYIGLALIPQAGVALGIALVAKSEFPQAGNLILTTIVATTVIYELIGPLFTRVALEKTGEIIVAKTPSDSEISV
jgi:Kef-type K+ transport system membrane component KefB